VVGCSSNFWCREEQWLVLFALHDIADSRSFLHHGLHLSLLLRGLLFYFLNSLIFSCCFCSVLFKSFFCSSKASFFFCYPFSVTQSLIFLPLLFFSPYHSLSLGSMNFMPFCVWSNTFLVFPFFFSPEQFGMLAYGFTFCWICIRTHFLFRKKHGPLGPSSSKASFPYSALPHQFRSFSHTLLHFCVHEMLWIVDI